MRHTYEFPSLPVLERLMAPMASAEDAIARLDERLRCSPLADGLNARLALGEACAMRLAEGELVHLEDLVLFDAGAYAGPAAPELSTAWHALRTLRHAQHGDAVALLRTNRPGESDAQAIGPQGRSDPFHDPEWDEAGRLAAWRDVLREAKRLPPVLAAALAWDAWLILQPEQRGAWRAPLVAALLLKARRKTTALLLPIATGWRMAKYRRHPAHGTADRLAGFLQWMIAAAIRAGKELDALALAQTLIQPKLARKRRSSRLGDLVSLLLSRPLVTAPMAARALGVSQQAVQAMLRDLAPPVRELSGRRRYRVWGIL
jgi:hypothetical protein